MADNKFVVLNSTEIACYNGGNDKTLIQVAASSTIALKVLGWSVSFDGINVTSEPVQVKLMRQTSAGTMTSLATNKLVDTLETIQATASSNATAEPASGALIDSFQVHPQAGVDVKYPAGEEPVVSPSDRIGIVVNAGSAVNCSVKIICEE